MPLIYIGGISGSGKSAVIKELACRGYEALDADDGTARHYNNKTGEAVRRPTNEEATSEWYANHTYKLPRKVIEKLARQSKNKPVFLGGSVANENEVWDLFSKVISLDIDEATLRERIAAREGNYFGKAPHELEHILKWHQSYRRMYENRGASIIDATKPLAAVVDEVLGVSGVGYIVPSLE